jgi:hypothetical protein
MAGGLCWRARGHIVIIPARNGSTTWDKAEGGGGAWTKGGLKINIVCIGCAGLEAAFGYLADVPAAPACMNDCLLLW